MRGIWRRASDRPRWLLESVVGVMMLPLSVLPIWLYMSKTDDGFLMYLRGRYAISAPGTPRLDAATTRLATQASQSRVRGVPVLVYHGLGRATSELLDDRYVVSRTHFAEHLRALRLAGFTAIDTATLARYLASGDPELLPRKPVLITFDDGRADAMIQADPILRDTGMRATMFVIGKSGSGVTFYYESWKRLRRYAESGRWELANHTYGLHRMIDDVKGVPPVSALVHIGESESLFAFEARIGADLVRNQSMLRERTGSRTSAFAYPYGDWGQDARRAGVVEAVRRAVGEHAAIAFDQDRQSGWRYALPQDDPLHLHRLQVMNWTGAELLARLRTAEKLTRTAFRERGLDVPYRPNLLEKVARRTVCEEPARVPLSRAGTASKVVALTFDGGPSAYTPQVLDVLSEHDARATFFVSGASLALRERLLWRMVYDGNEIGNETWSRAGAARLDHRALAADLTRTSEAIRAAARVTPCVSRPPYRDAVDRHAAVARSLGMTTTLWSVDPRDFESRRPAQIAHRVLRDVRPGSIVILHDGGHDRWATVQALGPILRGLEQRGYRTVTVSQLRSSS